MFLYVVSLNISWIVEPNSIFITIINCIMYREILNQRRLREIGKVGELIHVLKKIWNFPDTQQVYRKI